MVNLLKVNVYILNTRSSLSIKNLRSLRVIPINNENIGAESIVTNPTVNKRIKPSSIWI